MSEQLWQRTAGELADLISSKQVSSREVIDAHLERIEEVNGHLNAVTVTLTERAQAEADAADAAIAADEDLGPLHGVPFTIEDGQLVGRLKYEHLTDIPDQLYGMESGSSYQGQGLALSKHFRDWPDLLL